MKDYRIVVAQITYGDVVVKATNKREASRLALEACENDEINWEDTSHTDISLIEEI